MKPYKIIATAFIIQDANTSEIYSSWDRWEHAKGLPEAYEATEEREGRAPIHCIIQWTESRLVRSYLDAINAITHLEADGLHIETPEDHHVITDMRDLEDLARETATEWLLHDAADKKKDVARLLNKGYKVNALMYGKNFTTYELTRPLKRSDLDAHVTVFDDGAVTIEK